MPGHLLARLHRSDKCERLASDWRASITSIGELREGCSKVVGAPVSVPVPVHVIHVCSSCTECVCRANELHAALSSHSHSQQAYRYRAVYQINQDGSQINQEIWVSLTTISLTRYSPATTTCTECTTCTSSSSFQLPEKKIEILFYICGIM